VLLPLLVKGEEAMIIELDTAADDKFNEKQSPPPSKMAQELASRVVFLGSSEPIDREKVAREIDRVLINNEEDRKK
jgi:hypothetical protein